MGRLQKSRIIGIISVFMCNLMQMAMFALMPMLVSMGAYFRDYDETLIQTITTFPNLLVVFAAPLAGRMAESVNKRMLLQISAGCYLAAAAGGYFFHDSMAALYVWSCFLGIGIGILIPITSSLCSDFFQGTLRARIMGYQSTVVAAGGVMLSLLGGKLAAAHWYASYLAFLLIIPGLFMITLTLPGDIYARRGSGTSEKIRITPRIVLVYAGIALAVLSACNAVPMNISVYLEEIGQGDSVLAGAVSAVMQAGGAAAGLLFGVCVRRMRGWMFPAAFAVLALGIVCILTGNILMIVVGMFLAGYCMTTGMVSASTCISMEEKPEAVTLGIAVLMAVANGGGFTASFYTGLSQILFESRQVMFRYVLILILAVLMTAVTFIWQMRRVKGGEYR